MTEHRNKIRITGPTILFAGITGLICVALLIISNGNIIAAIVPILTLIALKLVINLPLQYSATALFTAMLLFANAGENPHENMWKGPLTMAGGIVYNNFNKMTGIGALKFNLVQTATFFFLFLMFLRTLYHNNIDKHLELKSAREMKIAAYVSFGAVVFSTVLGISRGGNTTLIPLQMMNLLFMPLMMIVGMRAYKGEKIYRLLGKMLIAICVLRTIEGAWFYFTVLRPSGKIVEYIMTHNDSFTYALGMMLLVVLAIEKPGVKSIRNLIVFGGIMLWGIIINDRRVCFVAIAFCMIMLYFFLKPILRKRINTLLIYALPVILLYVGIGMHSQSQIFAPVHVFTSINDEEDTSNLSRKVENMNMIYTLDSNTILGTGFGFPYTEVIPSFKLGYEWYQYVGHNQLLWLAFLMGGLGLFLFFTPLIVIMFLSTRVYMAAQTTNQRVVALMAIFSTIIYIVLAFGDMGAMATKGIVLMVVTGSIIANLSKKLKVI